MSLIIARKVFLMSKYESKGFLLDLTTGQIQWTTFLSTHFLLLLENSICGGLWNEPRLKANRTFHLIALQS